MLGSFAADRSPRRDARCRRFISSASIHDAAHALVLEHLRLMLGWLAADRPRRRGAHRRVSVKQAESSNRERPTRTTHRPVSAFLLIKPCHPPGADHPSA